MKGIYCIENKINGKKYYGSSMDIHRRLKSHRKGLDKGHHINVHLQRAYNLYGGDQFDYYVVENMGEPSRKELQSTEQWYINNNKDGYNIAPANGGDTISLHPDRTNVINKQKQGHKKAMQEMGPECRKLKYGKLGNKNPNWRNGGRKILCPVCLSNKIEPKYKTCGNCRNRSGKSNSFYGKKHSEKTLAKLRETGGKWIKGIDPSLLSYTTYYEIIYPNGNIKQVAGLKAIADEFGVSIANVHATIKRMSKGTTPSRSVFKNHIIKKVDR